MPTPLRLRSVLLLPICGLCLLISGLAVSPRDALLQRAVSDSPQRKPAWANPNRRVILRCQYRFFLHQRLDPSLSRKAAAIYNQCVDDSDPSVLAGTGLPRHVPVQ